MGIIDPIAMSNGMANGLVGYPGAAALWLTLVGLLVGSAAGVLFAGLPRWRPREHRASRGPAHPARQTPLAGTAS